MRHPNGPPALFCKTFILTIHINSFNKKPRADRKRQLPPALARKRPRRRLTATAASSTSRFHNLYDAALADALGRADAILKAAEVEVSALKDEIKARHLTVVTGDAFTVTVIEQISGRIDTKAVKAHLGSDYDRFEMPIVSTVVSVKPAVQSLAVAIAA